MRSLLIVLLLLAALSGAANAGCSHEDAVASLANGQTSTGKGWPSGNGGLTYGAAFTATATGNYTVTLQTTFDGGANWINCGTPTPLAAQVGANHYVQAFTASGSTQGGGTSPGVPGPRVRVKILNNSGAAITSLYLFVCRD